MYPSSWKLYWDDISFFGSSLAHPQVRAICSSEDDVEMILRQITIAIISIVIKMIFLDGLQNVNTLFTLKDADFVVYVRD